MEVLNFCDMGQVEKLYWEAFFFYFIPETEMDQLEMSKVEKRWVPRESERFWSGSGIIVREKVAEGDKLMYTRVCTHTHEQQLMSRQRQSGRV